MKLKALRINQGLSQSKLADLANVDQALISRIESGKPGFSPATMKAIADVLKVAVLDVEEFAERANEAPKLSGAPA